MKDKQAIWNRISELVLEQGLELFDLELPSSARGVLRVYISRRAGEQSGVNIDDCAAVSKRITNLEDVDSLIPDGWVIEVSSPGINRRLSRPEHFAGAVGERVKLTVSSYERESGTESGARPAKKSTLRGKLVSFDGDRLELQEESLKENVTVLLPNVQDARVDFQF